MDISIVNISVDLTNKSNKFIEFYFLISPKTQSNLTALILFDLLQDFENLQLRNEVFKFVWARYAVKNMLFNKVFKNCVRHSFFPNMFTTFFQLAEKLKILYPLCSHSVLPYLFLCVNVEMVSVESIASKLKI